MKTFTTKKASAAVSRELTQRMRQIDLVILQNASGGVQVELSSDELDDFERVHPMPIESDVISDKLMEELLQHLKRENLVGS